jgi:hypothetical protein
VAQGFAAGLAWLLMSAIGAPLVAASLGEGAAATFLRGFPFHALVTPIFVACLAMAVFYDGALDPALAIRRTAVYAVLGLGAVFVFSGIEGLAGAWLTQSLGLSAAGATWFAGGAASLLCGTVRGKATELGTRWLGPHLPERTLADLPSADAVVVVVDPCDERGDPDPLARLARLHAVARRTVPRFGGAVAFVAGDAVVLTFDSPDAAMRGIEALRAGWPADAGVLRVGMQAGRVVRVPEGGIVGTAVRDADRLRRQAAPGEVLASSRVAATE